MRVLKALSVFAFGGLSYGLLEILYRGQTHISMFAVGGLCFLLITALDCLPFFGGGLLLEAPLCAAVITAVEFASGVLINIRLGLGVWDYSALPLNLMGQICLPFSAIWLGLSVPAIFASRLLRRFCKAGAEGFFLTAAPLCIRSPVSIDIVPQNFLPREDM